MSVIPAPLDIEYGTQGQVSLYYRVHAADVPQYPVGETFSCIESPSPYIQNYGWRRVIWKIGMHVSIREKLAAKAERRTPVPERGYEVIKTTFLTQDEIEQVLAHVEAMR